MNKKINIENNRVQLNIWDTAGECFNRFSLGLKAFIWKFTVSHVSVGPKI